MKNSIWSLVQLFLGLLAGILMMSCGGGGSGGTGTLQVSITDLPSAAYSSVTLAVKEVNIQPGDDGDTLNVFTLPQFVSINVLDYSGHELQLGAGSIPEGSYSQVRLVLEENPAEGDPLNYVMLNCEELPGEFDCDPEMKWPLKTPSGHTSGVKILLPGQLMMDNGDVYRLTIDFDPSTAIVERGDYNPDKHPAKERFLIKPTGIRTMLAVGLESYGILTGTAAYSDDPVDGPLAIVSAFSVPSLEPVSATLVDPLEEGAEVFRLHLAAGDYAIDVVAPGYDTESGGPFTVTEASTDPRPETDAGAFVLDPL